MKTTLVSYPLTLALLSIFVLGSGYADIRLDGARLIASSSKLHKHQGQNIEILSSIGCNAKIHNTNTIELPQDCQYLHGLYRYVFYKNGDPGKRQSLTDFAVNRNGTKGHTLLVNETLEIIEARLRRQP